MAMLAIPVSSDISRLFRQINIGGKRDISDHITMIYFGDEMPLNRIVKAIPVIFDILKDQKPFKLSCKKIISFPEGKDGFPIVAELESKELHSLRKKIVKALKDKKVPFDEKWKVYRPHVTLSYSEEHLDDIKVEDCSWQANEISLYGGDVSDSRLFVNFPLGLSVKGKTVQAVSAFSQMLKISRGH